ncbi:thioredoxin domain-containing protein [Fodinibius halophilus]|uniref:Thioredoxin domain-containing protein n=1 Tax=Fodinibius halophilus TaxID=1736908 RepID=A0A6M1T5K3_9BACT|nr:thioredoxin domain-containing protein [Fodinibius halophilus]NGP89339.1 thioredoxin domain-containing protein [Fodinibius halophilus]
MADSPDTPTNRLAQESSPYLLQHADNPVDWYPWGEEAFEKARREDKPVLVSIGYATCHWCHVMAHESFEDEEIASLMNEVFVNIKVDREERPDIDNTYMLVCQMMTGSGGWPLNVFLTPNKEPFYAATYIPRQGRHGRPGMRELIPWISELWNNEREKITSSSEQIINAFKKSTTFESGERLTEETLSKVVQQYQQQFDKIHGGFGTSPKFPSPHNLMLLLRYSKQFSDNTSLQMVEKTLTQMRRGGIFDHIGLGFHRYATDQEWLVPHFEKMLYDQAMLMVAYTEAWQATGKELFRQTTHEIARYADRKMRNAKGGFYSAEDADSEGEEGKFYVWTIDQVREVLPTPEAELAIEVFNLTEEGNYNDEATGQRTGKNILHLNSSIAELAHERDMPVEQLETSLESIRQQLLEVRQDRTHPLLDDKILTDWNGLIMAALAKAGRAFKNDQCIKQSEDCWNFIVSNMIAGDKLKHRYRNGEVAIDAHADDFAFLIWGLIELYEATFKTSYLQKAVSLNKQFIDKFWDTGNGGFYFTSEEGEELLGRKKEIYDGAMPSSNSVAMLNLLRLGRLTGNTRWEEMADQCNKLFSSDIKKAPTGFGHALQSVSYSSASSKEIVIVGEKDHAVTQQMLKELNSRFLPQSVVLLKEPGDQEITDIASFTTEFEMKNGKPTAYVCQNYSCELPTNSPEKMLDLLNR